MPRFLENVNFPKLVTVLSVTFGVALGACGLTFVASNTRAGNFFVPLGIIEIAVMAISAAGLVVTVIVWIVAAAIGGGPGGGSGTIRLLDDDEKNKRR
jgi:hypothetical protein